MVRTIRVIRIIRCFSFIRSIHRQNRLSDQNYYVLNAFLFFSFALCSSTSACYDALHGQCLFQREHSVLANCLYVASEQDVRRCQTTACNVMSFHRRAQWRKEIRSVYMRSVGCPCFSTLPFLTTKTPVNSANPKVSELPSVE